MTWIDKLKKRYNLDSNLDLALVFILFAVTGSSSVKVGRIVLNVLNVSEDMNPWIFWPIRILVVFVIYQLLFVVFGFIIGLLSKPVWGFAWWFEKKMLSRFGIKFKESEK